MGALLGWLGSCCTGRAAAGLELLLLGSARQPRLKLPLWKPTAAAGLPLRPAPGTAGNLQRQVAERDDRLRRKDQELNQLRSRLDRLTAQLSATDAKVRAGARRCRLCAPPGCGWQNASRHPLLPSPSTNHPIPCSLSPPSAALPQHTSAHSKMEQDLLNCQGELAVVNNRCAAPPLCPACWPAICSRLRRLLGRPQPAAAAPCIPLPPLAPRLP